jgi:hypothetical protein
MLDRARALLSVSLLSKFHEKQAVASWNFESEHMLEDRGKSSTTVGSDRWLVRPYSKGKGKGKAIPLQALTGPEGFRRLRLLNFKTIGT